MIYLIDNYDSFTFNLWDYCQQFYSDIRLLRNDTLTIKDLEVNDPEGFIFSPGPGRPEEHPLMFEILERWHGQKPILGICLGFQAIASFYGATVEKAQVPVHGKLSVIEHYGHDAFATLPDSFSVTRYHSLVITDTGQMKNVSIIAKTLNEELPMALAHYQYPIWGFQYHPEAILTEHGLTVIYNWLSNNFLNVKY